MKERALRHVWGLVGVLACVPPAIAQNETQVTGCYTATPPLTYSYTGEREGEDGTCQ